MYIKKERLVKLNEIYYCRMCGRQMIENMIGAENYFEEYPECGKSYPYYRYNQKTGKRQYVYRYICPNKKLFRRHDDFINEKIITF